MSSRMAADGSSVEDRPQTVTIDFSDEIDRMRYRCPNGHASFTRTNSHIWCHGCADAAQRGHDVEPEHFEIHDARTGKDIPWSAVEIIEE
ncbi:hypothetical protein [Natronomonas marina]|uniref:hypothetical protein n=1 Tax=Natronomonas marina TaxID=2961939 RepID=UPI0020C9D0E1|nr:hypothetical protein [Natronomonas marina]